MVGKSATRVPLILLALLLGGCNASMTSKERRNNVRRRAHSNRHLKKGTGKKAKGTNSGQDVAATVATAVVTSRSDEQDILGKPIEEIGPVQQPLQDSPEINNTTEAKERAVEKGEDIIFCAQDVKACDNFIYVGRDPAQGCAFRPCPGVVSKGSPDEEQKITIPEAGTTKPNSTEAKEPAKDGDIETKEPANDENIETKEPANDENIDAKKGGNNDVVFCAQDVQQCGSVFLSRDPALDCAFPSCDEVVSKGSPDEVQKITIAETGTAESHNNTEAQEPANDENIDAKKGSNNDVVFCAQDVQQCGSVFLSRDPALDCAFPSCDEVVSKGSPDEVQKITIPEAGTTEPNSTEAQEPAEENAEAKQGGENQVIFCAQGVKQCGNVFVSRDPALNCAFPSCSVSDIGGKPETKGSPDEVGILDESPRGNPKTEVAPATEKNERPDEESSIQKITLDNMPTDIQEDFQLRNGSMVSCSWPARRRPERRCKEITATGEVVMNMCPQACAAILVQFNSGT